MSSADELEEVAELRRQVSEMARGFRAAQVLLTCHELGLFDAIAEGAFTEAEIAATVQADARGTALLLNAATALGLLEKREGRFVNTPTTSTCLTRAGAGYMGGLGHERNWYRRWGHLTEAVKTGQRPEENVRDEQDEEWARRFVLALYERSRRVAPAVAEALALPEDRPLRVLDVGGVVGGTASPWPRAIPFWRPPCSSCPAWCPWPARSSPRLAWPSA